MTSPTENTKTLQLKPLVCEVDPEYGIARIYGDVSYEGTYVTLHRVLSAKENVDPWVQVRGSPQVNVNPGGLKPFEDTEMPLGAPVRYRLTRVVPTGRFIQRQLIKDPSFEDTTAGTPWIAVGNHTYSSVTNSEDASPPLSSTADDTTRRMGKVTDGSDQEMLYTVPAPHTAGGPSLIPNRKYQLTGQVQFVSLSGDIWQEVYDDNAQTWDQLGAEGGVWSDLMLSAVQFSGASIGLFFSIKTGAGVTVLGPVQLIGMLPDRRGQWHKFTYVFTTPATVDATSRLYFSHDGSSNAIVSEFYFDTVQLIAAGDETAGGGLHPTEFNIGVVDYIDKDTRVEELHFPLPTGVEIAGEPGRIEVDNPAGTVTYWGPDTLVSYTECEIPGPPELSESIPCFPMFLNDPVLPLLGQWVGLVSIGDLTYAGRQEIHPIINMVEPVAASDVRQSPNFEVIIFTFSLDARKSLLDMLVPGRILFMRQADKSVPEDNWYISIGNVAESRPIPDVRRPERQWNLPCQRVKRPDTLIAQTTLRTWCGVMGGTLAINTEAGKTSLTDDPKCIDHPAAPSWCDLLGGDILNPQNATNPVDPPCVNRESPTLWAQLPQPKYEAGDLIVTTTQPQALPTRASRGSWDGIPVPGGQ